MLMDVQVGQCGSTAHVQGFSHSMEEADAHDIIRWCHYHGAYIDSGELYKESVQEARGSLLGFQLQYIW